MVMERLTTMKISCKYLAEVETALERYEEAVEGNRCPYSDLSSSLSASPIDPY